MIKKESVSDQLKFGRSGSAVRHLFWRLILVKIGSGNGLLPDDTKTLPDPVLSYHSWQNKKYINGLVQECGNFSVSYGVPTVLF